MRDLNALRAFRDVAKEGGYAAAERATGEARATLSRKVIALEQALGVRLIERSRRSFRLTEPGARLLRRCDELLAQLDDTLAMVDEEVAEPRGLVRIAIAPALLELGLGKVICEFLQEAPQVRVQLDVSNREVDLRYEEVDFVLSAGPEQDHPQDYVVVRLLEMERALVIHPRWRQHLRPSLEDTLREVPTVAWTGLAGRSRWRLLTADDEPRDLALEPRLIVDDIDTLRAALLEGIGIGIIPRPYVEEDLALGRLQLVQLDLRPPKGQVNALHLGRDGMRPAVRWLLDRLKKSASRIV